MKNILRPLLIGFVSWLLIFLASVCLFGLKHSNARLFEILMSIVLTACAAALSLLYFRKIRTAFVREGLVLGATFVCCNIGFDLPMFSAGPMKMPLAQYFNEIGFAYLCMPIISVGLGCALQRLSRAEHPGGVCLS